MSGYSEDYKDQQQAKWLQRWVPFEDESYLRMVNELSLNIDQARAVRFLLARAREAEAKHKNLRNALNVLSDEDTQTLRYR